MAEKDSFVLYTDIAEHIEWLPDEDAGVLFKALLSYASTGEIPENLSGAARMAFSFIRSQLDRDAEKYAQKCAARSEAGKRGAAATNSGKAQQKSANSAIAVFAENESDKAQQKSHEHEPVPEHEPEPVPVPDKNNNGGKPPKAAKVDVFVSHAAGNASLLVALRDFETMRNRIKRPMTDKAKQRLCSKLSAYPAEYQVEMLEKSTDKCWTDVYPDDRKAAASGYNGGKSTGERQLDEEELAALQRMLAEDSA